MRTGALLAAALAITAGITLDAQPAVAKVPEGLRDIARAYPAPDAQMTVARPLWDYLASLSRRHASKFVAPEHQRGGRLLLFRSTERVDRTNGDTMPNFLYD